MSYIIVTIIITMACINFLNVIFESSLINEEEKKNFCIVAVLINLETIIDALLIRFNGQGKNFVYFIKCIKSAEFAIAPNIIIILIYIFCRHNYWKKQFVYSVRYFLYNACNINI